MALSEFATWINPLLDALRELGGSARPREVVDLVARKMNVPDQTLDQTISGGVSRFSNQVHWARFYLAEAGLIDRSRRGVWSLTDKGRAAGRLTDDELRHLIADVQATSGSFKAPIRPAGAPVAIGAAKPTPEGGRTQTDDVTAPEDDVEGHRERLLALMKGLPPGGFERLCQRLLREAGFQNVTVTGRSGDGGIDGHGVLALNSFVSFRVLFQCKRYSSSVTPSEVRDFRGAMQGRADKGIIITTGGFSSDARREASRDGVPPIELVDGEKLVELFEHLELGLRPTKAYELDERFFDEYRS
jgi:restriction system protein